MKNLQETADLVTFTDKSLNEKLRFLCCCCTLLRIAFLHNCFTHFMPLASFDISYKQKIRGFLIFSESIERDQWHEMGLYKFWVAVLRQY